MAIRFGWDPSGLLELDDVMVATLVAEVVRQDKLREKAQREADRKRAKQQKGR